MSDYSTNGQVESLEEFSNKENLNIHSSRLHVRDRNPNRLLFVTSDTLTFNGKNDLKSVTVFNDTADVIKIGQARALGNFSLSNIEKSILYPRDTLILKVTSNSDEKSEGAVLIQRANSSEACVIDLVCNGSSK